jgi:hypothetical protein
MAPPRGHAQSASRRETRRPTERDSPAAAALVALRNQPLAAALNRQLGGEGLSTWPIRRPNRNGCAGRLTRGNTNAGSGWSREPTRFSCVRRCGLYVGPLCQSGSADQDGYSPAPSPLKPLNLSYWDTLSPRSRHLGRPTPSIAAGYAGNRSAEHLGRGRASRGGAAGPAAPARWATVIARVSKPRRGHSRSPRPSRSRATKHPKSQYRRGLPR